MAMKPPMAREMRANVPESSVSPFSQYSASDEAWPPSATVPTTNLSPSTESILSDTSIDQSIRGADITAPSPINSETTDFADVDESVGSPDSSRYPPQRSISTSLATSSLKLGATTSGQTSRPAGMNQDDASASTVHVPPSMNDPTGSRPNSQTGARFQLGYPADVQPFGIELTDPAIVAPDRTSSAQSFASDRTVKKGDGRAVNLTDDMYKTSVPPFPLKTLVPPASNQWTQTPIAQTRQEIGTFSRPGSSLASIAEGDDFQSPTQENASESTKRHSALAKEADDNIQALNQALSECWTLCNTLAGLSDSHRERAFNAVGHGSMQQEAWKSCWKLCQNLYTSRNQVVLTDGRTTLEYCRDFCQALFEVRARDDEAADSVLRVSFELNNHLFNMHDRNLPESYRERTIDFYVTLCHRLMQQKRGSSEEPNNLVGSCWVLAEVLFSLRQNKREGKRPDEELLTSAIQACWNLCDLFRTSWTAIRPSSRQLAQSRQNMFTQAFQQAKQSMSGVHEDETANVIAETPTTTFDESAAGSPYDDEVSNIPLPRPSHLDDDAASSSAASHSSYPWSNATPRHSTYKWPSASSVASFSTHDTSRSSIAFSSHEHQAGEDHVLVLLKSLFVRAALLTNRGFVPLSSHVASRSDQSSLTRSSISSLPQFVKTLPESAFGTQKWQTTLLEQYRYAVMSDATFDTLGSATDPTLIYPASDRTTTSEVQYEMARAVVDMMAGTDGWSWLRDLYRLCFGLRIEEALKQGTRSSPRASSERDDRGYRSDASNSGWESSYSTDRRGRESLPRSLSSTGYRSSRAASAGSTNSNRERKRSAVRHTEW